MSETPVYGFPLPSDQSRISALPWHLRNLSTVLEERLPGAVRGEVRSQLPPAVTSITEQIRAVAATAAHDADAAEALAADAVARVQALEAAAGFGPSTPEDGSIASLVLQEDSLTRDALDGRYAVWDRIMAAVTAEVQRATRTADITEGTGDGWRPAATRTDRLAVWGSSSAHGLATVGLPMVAGELGVTVVNGAKGGEASEHIAARLGSVPARLTFPGGVIPASGSVAVTAENMRPEQYLKGYFGYVSGVYGSITSDGITLKFNRATAGDAVTVADGTPFLPVTGAREQADAAILWMGKNDPPGEEAATIARVDASAAYVGGVNRRLLVLGHFVSDGSTPEETAKVHALNAAHAATYGQLYLDVQDWLTSAQLWDDLGITPTQADLDKQNAGQLPPSAQKDRHHMNDAAQRALARRVHERMSSLGWGPRAVPAVADDFNRSDNTAMGSTPTGAKTWYVPSGGGTNGYAGSFEIKNRRAVVETLNGTNWAAQVAACPSADGAVEMTVTDSNCGAWVRVKNSVGISVMWSAAAKKWRALTYPGASELAADPALTPLTPGDRLRVEMAGQQITVKVNGSSLFTFTDSTASPGVQHGMVGLTVGAGIDNWAYYGA